MDGVVNWISNNPELIELARLGAPIFAAFIGAFVAWKVMRRNIATLQSNNESAIRAAEDREQATWKRSRVVEQANACLAAAFELRVEINTLYNDVINAVRSNESPENFTVYFNQIFVKREKLVMLCNSFCLVPDKDEEDLWKLPFELLEGYIELFGQAMDTYWEVGDSIRIGKEKDAIESRAWSKFHDSNDRAADADYRFVQGVRMYLDLSPLPVSRGEHTGWLPKPQQTDSDPSNSTEERDDFR